MGTKALDFIGKHIISPIVLVVLITVLLPIVTVSTGWHIGKSIARGEKQKIWGWDG